MCERVCRYTREAGVRSLERKIGAICRAVAVKVAEGHKVSRAESPTEQHAGKTGTFSSYTSLLFTAGITPAPPALLQS